MESNNIHKFGALDMAIFGDYQCATTDTDLNSINEFEIIFTEHSAQQQQNTLFFFFRGTGISFFFPFIFISWRLITLQYCSGFCHTLT